MSPRLYSVDFDAPVYSVDFSTLIAAISSLLNAYMDASMRAITGGKYYPEGWS